MTLHYVFDIEIVLVDQYSNILSIAYIFKTTTIETHASQVYFFLF